MPLQEYIGSVVMEIDSQEIEITDLDVQIVTGRKLVKTMNRTGKARGYAQGIATYDLNITAIVPEEDEPDWENLVDVKITYYPLNDTDKRISYLSCFSTEVGVKYTVDSEAKIDIKMSAIDRVEE